MEVIRAVKVAIQVSPKKIHTMEKMRAAIDFGTLSPYLLDKKNH